MEILPLKLLSHDDQVAFGIEALNLAKLAREKFPVLEGVAISFWEDLKPIAKAYSLTDQPPDLVWPRLKKEIESIPLPDKLLEKLDKKDNYYFKGQIYQNKTQLWQAVLATLDSLLQLQLWHAQSLGKVEIKAFLIFYIKGKLINITAFYDPNLKEVLIEGENTLPPKLLKLIDQLVILGNKKLAIAQKYHFIVIKDELYLVGLTPFTHSLSITKVGSAVLTKKEPVKLIRSAVKVYLNISSGLPLDQSYEGILLEGEKLGNFDEAALKIIQLTESFPDIPIIYKLPDDKKSEARGTYGLINRDNLLNPVIDLLLFLKEKKNLVNLEICLPFLRSTQELDNIKERLSKKGVKITNTWLEIALPENIINFDQYLNFGISGLIIDLDHLPKMLAGFAENEADYLHQHLATTTTFIQPLITKSLKNKIPVLVKGRIVLHPDVLDFLVEVGVSGIVADNKIEAASLPELLAMFENRLIYRRLNNLS